MVDQNSTIKKGGPMIHGVYAKDFLLPWEDQEEFSALHDGLKREFFPNGQSEDETVFELAQLYWQKRTLSRLRTAAVLADPCTQEIVATGEKSWRAIRRSLRQKGREERKVVKTIGDKFLTALSNVSRLSKKIKDEPATGDTENLIKQLAAGLKLLKEDVLPELRKIQQLPDVDDALDKHFIPEDLEKFLGVEAIIDTRIAKVTARLVATKEFKRTPAGSPLKQITARVPASG
jgi:hypothetical protein